MQLSLTIEDLWIKAAVEHRLVTITYMNPETRLVYTKRDVRPDFVGEDPRSGKVAVWGLLNHNPFVGMKSFIPDYFQSVALTNDKFQPPKEGRWKELVHVYEARGLDKAA